jgi:hypothetical protein
MSRLIALNFSTAGGWCVHDEKIIPAAMLALWGVHRMCFFHGWPGVFRLRQRFASNSLYL